MWCAQPRRGVVDDEGELDSALRIQRVCSHCAEESLHSLRHSRLLLRDAYECENCQQRTVACVSCDRAMARGGALVDDLRCGFCDGSFDKVFYRLQRL